MNYLFCCCFKKRKSKRINDTALFERNAITQYGVLDSARDYSADPNYTEDYTLRQCDDSCNNCEDNGVNNCNDNCDENDCNKDYIETQDIVLNNDKTITTLDVHDCLSINIHNCIRITKIPDMYYFKFLENIRICHCTIKVCDTYFPDTLRILHITYSCMEEFIPKNYPNKLAELDLSFNFLKKVPLCLESNRNAKINLGHNEFWYQQKFNISNIESSKTSEIKLAHELNLIGTDKVQKVIDVYKNNNKAVVDLVTVLNTEKPIVSNKQSVHLTSVENSTLKSIEYILKKRTPPLDLTTLNNIITTFDLDSEFTLDRFNKQMKHNIYNTTYIDIFYKVYCIIIDLNNDELMNLFIEEVKDSTCTCLTGQLVRMCNSLAGFVDEIKINLSSNEELSNMIIALRKRYAIKYPNKFMYVRETIPAVMQLLEDSCIDISEQDAWLEYV